ncbi:hypothetical protein V473_08595 [Sphingobium cupriresistens LL01]|uniref:Uncharacterized protein n=1 Tax=Sphingobium cupriresistens LL01 TaxID=1420583 RepID=A0A0J7Y4F0_9SPHN|nr:hypothetical protein V473_08595 [Sphingobium cupriresistens LL01]
MIRYLGCLAIAIAILAAVFWIIVETGMFMHGD